jgi:hypothetical protein
MQTLSQLIFLISAVVTAAALVMAVVELRGIGAFLRTGTLHVWVEKPPVTTNYRGPTGPSTPAFAYYIYRQGKWHLEGDFSKPGYEAAPPKMLGTYDGQVVKTECVLKAKG